MGPSDKKEFSKKNLPSAEQKNTTLKPRTTISQAALIIIISLGLFFGLLEGGLTLLGIKPVIKTEDPFVGFASTVPLFIPSQETGGGQTMITAPNKRNVFNRQEFIREKSPDTYRIFCMGGSTTYGRPYDDTTSFAGWLRELLPRADGNKNWEVINAGGISYASYRVAHLMEELINYQPDLFIIYTGHNEFLEERTYRKIRNIPPLVRSTVSLLARTRTWSVMTTTLKSLGIHPSTESENRDTLAAEVDTILDRSVGPGSYTRDDPLHKRILDHYRISLKRMLALARSVEAQVILVTPGSNLKDSSPFKSEHTEGLDPAGRKRSEQTLTRARAAISDGRWDRALDLLEKAVATDPRHADLQYLRGKALLASNRFDEAKTALRRARDEDVCPLRALTPMRGIVSEVARDQKAGLVDYVDLLEKHMQDVNGYTIPGKELFLDHVHPTIGGNRILAVALVQQMADQGLVRLGPGWGEQAVLAATETVESRIDREDQGQALANLARVLLWADKKDEAARLARQALETADEYDQVTKTASTVLSTYYQRKGYLERARQQLYLAIESAPETVKLRMKLGSILLERPYLAPDEAAAHLLWVINQWPDKDTPYQLFVHAMALRGRLEITNESLMKALSLNPKNEEARKALAQISPFLDKQQPSATKHDMEVETYPNFAPRKLVQVGRDAAGSTAPDGIEVEFYDNGRVKRLLDFNQGVQNGFEITWDSEGKVLSRIVKQQGTLVNLEARLQALYSAVENAPGDVELRLKLGQALLQRPFLKPDEAAANLLWVCQQTPDNDVAYQLFGQAMIARGRFEIAYGSLIHALRRNPRNMDAQKILAQIRPLFKEHPPGSLQHKIHLESYPSLAPHKIVQLGYEAQGRSFPDGIEVEFYENGRIKHLLDFNRGVPEGLEISWDTEGRIISSVVHISETPAVGELGKSD
jgi:tetratricopeptide (TPR) repeat protein